MQTFLQSGVYVPQSQTFTLKTPVLLPYANDWSHFERTTGTLVVGTSHYTAEKWIIRHDSLYTVYIKDPFTNRLYDKLDALFGLFSAVPESNTGQTHLWDSLLREYFQVNQSLLACISLPRTALLMPSNPLSVLSGTSHPPGATARIVPPALPHLPLIQASFG